MHLSEYRKEVGLSQREFGAKLSPPASPGLVSQWECGTTRVTLEYALQIDEETEHKVTPQDCADMYVADFSEQPKPAPLSHTTPNGAKARESKGRARQPIDPSKEMT